MHIERKTNPHKLLDKDGRKNEKESLKKGKKTWIDRQR